MGLVPLKWSGYYWGSGGGGVGTVELGQMKGKGVVRSSGRSRKVRSGQMKYQKRLGC